MFCVAAPKMWCPKFGHMGLHEYSGCGSEGRGGGQLGRTPPVQTLHRCAQETLWFPNMEHLNSGKLQAFSHSLQMDTMRIREAYGVPVSRPMLLSHHLCLPWTIPQFMFIILNN